MTPKEILYYGDETFLSCLYLNNHLIIRVPNDLEIDFNNNLKVSIDFDNVQVFDKEKNIRLV